MTSNYSSRLQKGLLSGASHHFLQAATLKYLEHSGRLLAIDISFRRTLPLARLAMESLERNCASLLCACRTRTVLVEQHYDTEVMVFNSIDSIAVLHSPLGHSLLNLSVFVWTVSIRLVSTHHAARGSKIPT